MKLTRWAFVVDRESGLHAFLQGPDVISAAAPFPRTEPELVMFLRDLADRIEKSAA